MPSHGKSLAERGVLVHFERVASALADSREAFQRELRAAIKRLGLSVTEFASRAGIPVSTLYKALGEARDPKLSTVRALMAALKRLERPDAAPFIAVVASRPFLNEVVRTSVVVQDVEVPVREYPAHSAEEAIVAAVQAERDGAAAVVCAPIVTPTIERILAIPIFALVPLDSLRKTVELAVQRLDLGDAGGAAKQRG